KIADKLVNSTEKGVKIIDIGTGSGFMALALNKLFGPNSVTYALDHIQEIVDFSRNNISKKHQQYIDSQRIQFVCGDRKIGLPDVAPFHIIHVGAGCV